MNVLSISFPDSFQRRMKPARRTLRLLILILINVCSKGSYQAHAELQFL